MSHDLSHYSLFLITQNKINLSLFLSITWNFIFFLPTNQPIFPHLTSPLLSTNHPTFPHPTLHKLSSLTTLQRPTRNGGVAVTRPSIHIAHYLTKNGDMAAIKPSIYIAHHPTRDGDVAATRPYIHITHHFFSLV